MREARRRTRLEDFGDPPIDRALTILVNSLEREADLHPLAGFLCGFTCGNYWRLDCG